mmetsp:Transcript_31686/g.34644  ORF Transcript_31686/g.34644 Transcript_31686/m.34644 type:complete len:265 (+) Transcript_31686:65-859(+)
MMTVNLSFFSVIVLLALLSVAQSFNEEKDIDPSKVIKQDLPYIKCEVCERAIAELIPAIDEIKEEHNAKFKKTPLEEVKILEVIENICKPAKDNGAWIRKLDISETTNSKKKYLSIVEPGGVAKCQSECLTIAKSCEDLFENDLDMDDLSALLWKKSMTIDDAQEKICRKLTKRCGEFPPAVSGNYKRKNYPFNAIPEKELEMEKLMASMKEMGMGGSMYNRDDLESMMAGGMGGLGDMAGMDGYDEEFDDEEAPTRPGSNIEL